MSIRFPPSRQPIAGGSVVDPHWERWFGDLAREVNDAGSSTPAPPVEIPSFVVSGAGSVTADGSVAGGEFVVTLVGDADNPLPGSLYGVDSSGNKGFVPLYDGLEEGQGIALRDSGYIIVDAVATPSDLPATGNAGEAVRVTESEVGIYAWDGSAFTLDTAATGVVSVTCDATAAEIPYDNTTSGLAATDTQAAIDEVAGTVVSAGAWLTQKKNSDQSRSSSATPAADSELHFAAAAATRYHARGKVFYSIANATMDFLGGPAYSGTTISVYNHRRFMPAGTAGGTDSETTSVTTSFVNSALLSASAGVGFYEFDVIFMTNSAGTFSFDWAQNTSDAGALTVLAGSYLEYAAF